MASQFTHLAIAKLFIQNNPGLIKNETAFYDGSILPDLTENKQNNSHYEDRSEKVDLIKRHREKVNPAAFLNANKLDNDLNRGVYLHLLTDWEYYNNHMDHDYLRSVQLPEAIRDFIYTSNMLDEHITKKYGISPNLLSIKQQYYKTRAEWEQTDMKRYGTINPIGKLLLTPDQIDEFIMRMSRVTLP